MMLGKTELPEKWIKVDDLKFEVRLTLRSHFSGHNWPCHHIKQAVMSGHLASLERKMYLQVSAGVNLVIPK